MIFKHVFIHFVHLIESPHSVFMAVENNCFKVYLKIKTKAQLEEPDPTQLFSLYLRSFRRQKPGHRNESCEDLHLSFESYWGATHLKCFPFFQFLKSLPSRMLGCCV